MATWGNLVNRVLTISARNFDGTVPTPAEMTPEDQTVLDLASKVLTNTAEAIEKVELRAGLRAAMDAASEVNAYLNATEPWKLLKTDRDRAGTVLWSAIQAIAGIRVATHPYLPHSSAAIGDMLGIGPEVESWTAPHDPRRPVPGRDHPPVHQARRVSSRRLTNASSPTARLEEDPCRRPKGGGSEAAAPTRKASRAGWENATNELRVASN